MIVLNFYNGIIIFGLSLCIIVLLFIIFKYIFAEKALNTSINEEKQNNNNIKKMNIVGDNIKKSDKKFATVVKSSKFVTSNNQNINVVALGNDEILIFSDDFFNDMSEEEQILQEHILSEDEANVMALENYFYETPQDYTKEEWENLLESGLAEEFGLSNSDLVNRIVSSDLEEVIEDTSESIESKDVTVQIQNSFYNETTNGYYDDDTSFDVNYIETEETENEQEEQEKVSDVKSSNELSEPEMDSENSSEEEQEKEEEKSSKPIQGDEGIQGALF